LKDGKESARMATIAGENEAQCILPASRKACVVLLPT